jgi:hypothetical protein
LKLYEGDLGDDDTIIETERSVTWLLENSASLHDMDRFSYYRTFILKELRTPCVNDEQIAQAFIRYNEYEQRWIHILNQPMKYWMALIHEMTMDEAIEIVRSMKWMMLLPEAVKTS